MGPPYRVVRELGVFDYAPRWGELSSRKDLRPRFWDCPLERTCDPIHGFVIAPAAYISGAVSVPEQISGRIWSNGASTSVCFGTDQGFVSIFGSYTVASISSVSAFTRR